jgi:Protein of unknown function (DUF2946)
MDPIVRRAMARWPNVPAVYDWLALDRRGSWRVRLSELDPDRFDRITSPAVIAFIARNYDRDEAGQYFFQNGPQRVYVALDYAPWVLRLADDRSHLVTHTDAVVVRITSAWVDENGAMLVSFENGVGLVLDRDLEAVIDRVCDADSAPIDAERLLDRVAQGEQVAIALFGVRVPIASIETAAVPQRFGFVRRVASTNAR